jgi:hypothetical protein
MAVAGARGDPDAQEVKLEVYATYSTVLIVLTVVLLVVAAGIGKKQLVWKRPRPLPVRSRRHTP